MARLKRRIFMKLPSLLDMLKAGMHFGHLTSKRHPKMAPFIYGVRSNVHIIDLEIANELFEKALTFAKDVAGKDGIILFVSTKKQAQTIVHDAAVSCGMPFMVNRWIGGLLTNFFEVKRVIKQYNNMILQKENGEFGKLTKKNQASFEREFTRLNTMVEGIKEITKLPDALFVIDLKKEKTAVAEARKVGIPIIGLVDTNVNPEMVTYPIPGNDDAVKSIELVSKTLAECINEGKKNIKKEEIKK
jgi:small subunit ribosomal protein S2